MSALPNQRMSPSILKQSFATRFWRGQRRTLAWTLTITLLILTVAQVAIPVAINTWNRHLFDALELRDIDQLFRQVAYAVLIILANMFVLTSHLLIRRRLQVEWRSDLTLHITTQWVSNGRQDQLSQIAGQHDNPDGRIAEDIRIATEHAIDLAHSLLYCLLLLISFTQILWALSGSPQVNLGFARIWLPGHLVWAALLYAGAGAAFATWLGRPLVVTANVRQAREADFRFGLVRARDTSLTVALQSAQSEQRSELERLFGTLVGAWRHQTKALANLFMFSSSWSIMTQTVPVLTAAPRYMTGEITLGALMQTAQAFQQMIAALSWPIDNMQKLAECRASFARVNELQTALTELARLKSDSTVSAIKIGTGATAQLAFHDVSLNNAAGKPLLEHFDGAIGASERVVIDGDPVVALSLFRAIGGIWPWGSGQIFLPADDGLVFVPRRLRLCKSTLRNALGELPAFVSVSDSWSRRSFSPQAAAAALSAVGLPTLIPDLDREDDWSERLTSQQCQRLAFARLLLLRPPWILMREATSFLPSAEAIALFELLSAELPRSTIIAIGHDMTRCLTGYRLIDLTPSQPSR